MTPPDKNGNSVFFTAVGTESSIQMGGALLPAPDGNAFAFTSTGVFADDALNGGYGGFVSKRTDGGWVTQYVTPRVTDRPRGILGGRPLMFDRVWSEERLIFVSRPTPAETAVWQTDGDGSNPVWLSLGSLGPSRGNTRVTYGGRSADSSHVVFTSQTPLEPGVPRITSTNADTHLYERLRKEGITRPVGVLPDGTIPAAGADLGSGILSASGSGDNRQNGDGHRHAISADGRVIFFQVQPSFAQPETLYARVDGERTLHISRPTVSGGTAPIRGDVYQDATPDGSSVFFLSDGQLTPDAPASGTNLYRWTFNAARTDGTLTLISRDNLGGATRAEIGLVGAAQDGRSGWFVSSAALGGEGIAGRPNLYRFDDDGPRFVATLADTDQLRIVPARVGAGRDYLGRRA